MSKKMEWFWGILINVSFVISILVIDYHVGEQRISKRFIDLWQDSDRQEVLITDNKEQIDSTKVKVDKNKSNIDEIAKLTADQYEKLKRLNELQSLAEQQLNELQYKIDSLKGLSADLIVPFEKEFGVQDNYIRVFGRTGLDIDNNMVVNSSTDIGFDGMIALGEPRIEQIGKSEFKAVMPSQEFEGIRLKGSETLPVRMKIPRNQISVGPMVGITYDKATGLTEPIWGFGVTYNAIKLVDWR
tara:strand:+ start:15 stop:743 length:729 start_codon:yes stop_codon:yes gene_type:complete